MDTLSMVLSGFAFGILITFIGGLMAIDIASKKASGAALRLVGIASYIGVGLQDMASRFIIETGKSTIGNKSTYDITIENWFWLGLQYFQLDLPCWFGMLKGKINLPYFKTYYFS